jgi:hypothetical protein
MNKTRVVYAMAVALALLGCGGSGGGNNGNHCQNFDEEMMADYYMRQDTYHIPFFNMTTNLLMIGILDVNFSITYAYMPDTEAEKNSYASWIDGNLTSLVPEGSTICHFDNKYARYKVREMYGLPTGGDYACAGVRDDGAVYFTLTTIRDVPSLEAANFFNGYNHNFKPIDGRKAKIVSKRTHLRNDYLDKTFIEEANLYKQALQTENGFNCSSDSSSWYCAKTFWDECNVIQYRASWNATEGVGYNRQSVWQIERLNY